MNTLAAASGCSYLRGTHSPPDPRGSSSPSCSVVFKHHIADRTSFENVEPFSVILGFRPCNLLPDQLWQRLHLHFVLLPSPPSLFCIRMANVFPSSAAVGAEAAAPATTPKTTTRRRREGAEEAGPEVVQTPTSRHKSLDPPPPPPRPPPPPAGSPSSLSLAVHGVLRKVMPATVEEIQTNLLRGRSMRRTFQAILISIESRTLCGSSKTVERCNRKEGRKDYREASERARVHARSSCSGPAGRPLFVASSATPPSSEGASERPAAYKIQIVCPPLRCVPRSFSPSRVGPRAIVSSVEL